MDPLNVSVSFLPCVPNSIPKHTIWSRIYRFGRLASPHHIPIHDQDKLSNVVVSSVSYRTPRPKPHLIMTGWHTPLDHLPL